MLEGDGVSAMPTESAVKTQKQLGGGAHVSEG